MNYEEAIASCAEASERIREALTKVGFKRDELKTLNFSVNTEYKSEPMPTKEYRRSFDGYRVSHRLSLSFGVDTALLGRVLAAVGSCDAEPEIRIVFDTRNREKLSRMLLKRAAEDALAKATVLAKASKVALGELAEISYGGEAYFDSPTDCNINARCFGVAEQKGSGIDFVPEELTLTDTAYFSWRIV